MKRGIRKQEGEDLSSTKLEQVISLLNQDKPITKKDACSMLNINYNTTRLNRIIDEYNEQKEHAVAMRKQLRNKPLDKSDIAYIVESYLESGNLSEISDITFRSTSTIKTVLDRYNIPLRSTEHSYHNPVLLNDDAIADDYTKDDLVYSACYAQSATISNKLTDGIYRIWLNMDCQYAYQPYYELGDLRKLQQDLGVAVKHRKMWDVDDEGNEPIIADINRALINAKKRKKNE